MDVNTVSIQLSVIHAIQDGSLFWLQIQPQYQLALIAVPAQQALDMMKPIPNVSSVIQSAHLVKILLITVRAVTMDPFSSIILA